MRSGLAGDRYRYPTLYSKIDKPIFRGILSRHPQINPFERVSSPGDWDVLYGVKHLANPRFRDEVNDIRLVRPEDRRCGDGASWIMAAVTHRPVDGRAVDSIWILASITARLIRKSPLPSLRAIGHDSCENPG